MSTLRDGGTLILPRPLAAPAEKPASDACLVLLHPAGPDIGRRTALERPTYLVGRDTDADLVVARGSVSRHHGRLTRDEAGAWWVEDLGSTNGTFINEQRLTRGRLAEGDLVRFGDAIYKFLSGSNVESAYHEAIHTMAIQDAMTGVYNKRYFTEFLDREVAAAARHGHPLTLVMLDVDHFKQINDTHGHLAGDAVLKELASRIRARVRREDLFARYGGEEFACLLPITALPGGVIFAEHLRALIEERPCRYDGRDLAFTISLGVATLQHELEADGTTLIRRADEQLYASKRAGRNRVSPRVREVLPGF
ncbi:MAG: GGDEF domain-containing protein [Kofleriaceae bacterium]